MADLLSDDGLLWAVDGQRLEEITLLTEVMIEATARSGPLTQVEVDALLARTSRVGRLVPRTAPRAAPSTRGCAGALGRTLSAPISRPQQSHPSS